MLNMRRIAIIATLLCCCVIPCASSVAQERRAKVEAQEKQEARQQRPRRRGPRPEIFERPERAKWQKPDEVVKRIGLRPGQIVADIGAGSGYFSRRFAAAVRPGGFVFACDIDQVMLRYIQDRCKEKKIDNIVTVLAATWSPMLPPQSVDVIFLCNTTHHIKNRVQYFRTLKKVLKPGGRIVIVDFFKRKLPIGPPPDHKLARAVVLHELKEAGYELLVDDTAFLPYQYYLEFAPAKEPATGN